MGSPFIAPGGDFVTLADADAINAPSLGYVPATPKQIEDHEKEEKYSTTGQVLKTFGESAADTATFGLSTLAETKLLGVDPEDIKNREEINPVASGVGTAAGIGIPMLLPGVGEAAGIKALGTIGEHTAPGLIAKAGKAVSAAAGEALPEATSLLGKAAVKAAKIGAGSAIEGAFYSTGHVVHEAALGDPNLTAQNAIAQIGLGALLGGGLGGVVGAGEELLPAAIRKANEALGAAAEKTKGAYARASWLHGKTPEEIEEILASGGKRNLLTPEFAKEHATAIGQADEALEHASNVYHAQIKPGVREAMLSEVDSGKAIGQAQETINDLRAFAEDVRAKEISPKSYAIKAEGLATDLERALRGETNTHAIFEKLDDTKRQLYQWSKPMQDPAANEAAQGIGNIWSKTKQGLESPEVWGKAGTQQGRFNAAFSTYQDAREAMLKQFADSNGRIDAGKVARGFKKIGDPAAGDLRNEVVDNWQTASKQLNDAIAKAHTQTSTGDYDPKSVEAVINKSGDLEQQARKQSSLLQSMTESGGGHGGNSLMESVLGGAALGHFLPGAGHVIGGALGPVHAAYSALKNPSRMAEILGHFERINTKIANAIEGSAGEMLSAPAKLAERRAGKVGAQLAGASDVQAKIKEIQTLSNPDVLSDRVAKATEHVGAHAPDTAQALRVAASTAVGFLATKIPQTSKIGAFGYEIKPSKAELNKFDRYHAAVNKPLSILEHAKSGSVSTEEIEAVSAVYPQLMKQIRASVLNSVANHRGDPIPYQRKLMLSQLSGEPFDWTMTGQGIASLQSLMTKAPVSRAPPPGQPRGSKAGAAKITTPKRAMTPMQAAQSPDRK